MRRLSNTSTQSRQNQKEIKHYNTWKGEPREENSSCLIVLSPFFYRTYHQRTFKDILNEMKTIDGDEWMILIRIDLRNILRLSFFTPPPKPIDLPIQHFNTSRFFEDLLECLNGSNVGLNDGIIL